MAVVVPFASPGEPSIDPLLDRVAADMERVNGVILARTGSEVAMIPEVANHLIDSGGKRLRPILTLALARLTGYAGDGHIKPRPPWSSCTPPRCCTTTSSTKARCGADGSPRGCCGGTRPACWSAISCSARRSR